MRTGAITLALLGLSATTAAPMDLSDMSPCLPAAMRFCDRDSEMTWSNLRRCGATLAAHRASVGDACRDVLRRYRQL